MTLTVDDLDTESVEWIRKLDLAALVKRVREVAASQPRMIYGEYYSNCYYQVCGVPACIIGRALAYNGYRDNLKMLDSEMWESEFGLPGSDVRSVFNFVRYDAGVADLRMIQWLGHVQFAQDKDYSWATAIDLADEVCPLI